ncbi:MAG TPA: TonB-dependent receptor [Candidatus Kryptonia bacterium]
MFSTLIRIAGLFSLAPFVLLAAPTDLPNRASISGKVTEKTDGHPIAYAEVVVLKGMSVVTGTTTDELGNFQIKNLPPDHYTIQASTLGFKRALLDTTLTARHYQFDFPLESSDITLQEVTVTAAANEKPRQQRLDIATSAPVFQEATYHTTPTSLPSTIIQQNLPGAVQAPSGEVHIRGQHAEYSYNVDGLPVPETQSEGMTELFDPRVIDRISFLVGDLPAEYSDALAIIDVRTKIPATSFNAGASGYVGSFNSSGQSLSFTGHTGNFAYFLAGSRKITDRRIDTPLPDIFHDHGEDLFGLGKIQYILSPDDIIALDIDQSKSTFQVPYDSTGGINANDNQQESDGFQDLIFRHGFGSSGNEGDFFLGLTHRRGSLSYSPGENDVPSFYFAGDSTAFNISETRKFDVYGAKTDVTIRPEDELSIKGGSALYYTTGNEDFSAFNGNSSGPQSSENLRGYDFGIYAQSQFQPLPVLQLSAGIRYDQHYAKGIGQESQVSPKIKLTYLPDFSTTTYVYYGRIFVPVLAEQLREITGSSGTISAPTKAVRGNYVEAGITQALTNSLSSKLVGYYTSENPGMDDNTIPGTNLETAVNIQNIFVRGVELGLDYHPAGPFSGFFNIALSHAEGDGKTSGGFLPALPPTTAFDLDHDQRITYTVGLNLTNDNSFAGLIGSYGSGLTNGLNNGHVSPHFILNGSLGKTFFIGSYSIKPEFFVNNILNHEYLLKGSFFSGEAWGEPRNILLKISLSAG